MPTDGHWHTVAAFLTDRTKGAPGVTERLLGGEVLLSDGTVVDSATDYRPGDCVFLYRDLPDEAPVPGTVHVLYVDDDIVVVDKPHFLATIPRGRHVAETVLVRLRRDLGLPELSPAHRLDRLTAGVLLLTTRREVRGAYQELFARRAVTKIYHALAPTRRDLPLPTVLRSRIVKRRGMLQAEEVPGEPNAVTRIDGAEQVGEHLARYRLIPTTGRTHQLRVHLASIGLPIVGDPLYPTICDVDADDFSQPLQLLAAELEFTDPITGRTRHFHSTRTLQHDC